MVLVVIVNDQALERIAYGFPPLVVLIEYVPAIHVAVFINDKEHLLEIQAEIRVLRIGRQKLPHRVCQPSRGHMYVQFQNPEMLLHCQRILAIPMKETEKRFVEYLPEQALRELLSLPDQTKKYGIRDTALLCLLYDSGARVQELIDLSLLDIRLETPATIRLYGKGRKVRVVPLMSQTATILQKYLNMWHLDAARKPDDPVFVNHQGKRLTRPGVTYILNKYMAQVSWMEGKKGITPHIIRHSKAMHLLRADVDLHYIRDFLGHVQIETTEVYARADAEMKRKALETANLDLPTESQTSWQKDQILLSWLQSL